ncbi:MAG: cyclopropane-fatty-acyl-phospholipid synthase [Candidatus Rokuibacteriota bacterium]|nr:MAG: cyclopropane-fatty-acyl-phospholipid synthase [Candidatus Rokubacteria bacterium]
MLPRRRRGRARARSQRRGDWAGDQERDAGRRGGRGASRAGRRPRGLRGRDRATLRIGGDQLARPAARADPRFVGARARPRRSEHGGDAAARRIRAHLRNAGGGVVRARSKEVDAKAIAHHYDVSNEFYALFLDPLMVYTCAYYRDPDGKLEQAQRDKLDLVCRKLELEAGETLLDIGCGWGSLAIWAAQHYGVRAHGVTLSKAQADYATGRIRREGLEDRCRVEYRDYRDLPPDARFDKIAAVGVIEHVGIPNYPAFFGGVRRMLRDGGLYLNHGIVHEFHWKATSQTEFLYRHVFPNGDLAGLSETLTEIERAGFEIVDVEGLRLHYARTCRQWVERLRERADEARALAGERTYRTWLLYLTCSAVAFAESSIGLYQVLTRKQHDPVASRAPHTREHLYGRAFL